MAASGANDGESHEGPSRGLARLGRSSCILGAAERQRQQGRQEAADLRERLVGGGLQHDPEQDILIYKSNEGLVARDGTVREPPWLQVWVRGGLGPALMSEDRRPLLPRDEGLQAPKINSRLQQLLPATSREQQPQAGGVREMAPGGTGGARKAQEGLRA